MLANCRIREESSSVLCPPFPLLLSRNRYFPRIYNLSGYPSSTDLHRTCPRAQLFAREQAGVSSVKDLQRVLRLNRFKDDPLSGGNPADAIAAR